MHFQVFQFAVWCHSSSVAFFLPMTLHFRWACHRWSTSYSSCPSAYEAMRCDDLSLFCCAWCRYDCSCWEFWQRIVYGSFVGNLNEFGDMKYMCVRLICILIKFFVKTVCSHCSEFGSWTCTMLTAMLAMRNSTHLHISVPAEPARRASLRRNHKTSVSCMSAQPEHEAELMEYHYQGHCRRQLWINAE